MLTDARDRMPAQTRSGPEALERQIKIQHARIIGPEAPSLRTADASKVSGLAPRTADRDRQMETTIGPRHA